MLLEVFDESGLVVPAVECFEEKRPEQLSHRVLSGDRIAVVRAEVDVFERIVNCERLD